MRVATVLVLIAAWLVGPGADATAQPYDGSVTMKCAIQTVMVCNDPSMCVRGTAATVNLPQVLVVDVVQRRISGDASGRTVRITGIDRGAGKTMLRGVDVQALGQAWDLVIDEKSGSMTGAVVSQGGFLVFGNCAAAP